VGNTTQTATTRLFATWSSTVAYVTHHNL